MRPFLYQRAGGLAEAVQLAKPDGSRVPPTLAPTQYLAGGTTLIDLMKLDVMRPETLVDVNRLDPAGSRIERNQGLREVAAIGGDAIVADPEHGMLPIDAVERGASAPGLALVARRP